MVRVSSSSQRYYDDSLSYWDDGSLVICVSCRHCCIKKAVGLNIAMMLHVGHYQNSTRRCKQDDYVLFLFFINKYYQYCIFMRRYAGVLVWNIITLIIIRWFQGDGVVMVGVQLMWICKTGGKRYVLICFVLIYIWLINISTSTSIIVSIGSNCISIEKKHVLIHVSISIHLSLLLSEIKLPLSLYIL